MPSTAAQRDARRRSDQRKRAAQRLAQAPGVPDPVPVSAELPVLVQHDAAPLVASAPVSPLPAPPATPALPAAPRPVPAPPRAVPRRTIDHAPLSPTDLQAVSLFSAHWLQEPSTYNAQLDACGGDDAARYKLWCDALREAAACVPLLRQQYHHACVGVDGPQSQEAVKIHENLAWAEALLAQRDAG